MGKVGTSGKTGHTRGWILEGGLGWIERVTGRIHMIRGAMQRLLGAASFTQHTHIHTNARTVGRKSQ